MKSALHLIPVQFDSFFKEPKKQIVDYLKRVPREFAIRFALLMSNFKHETDWRSQLEKMAFDYVVKQCCTHILQAKENELKELSKGVQDFEIVLFTQLTGLEILRILFSIPTHSHKFKSHEWQGNLLKAITLVNDELVKDIPSFKNGSLYRFTKSVKTYKYELDDRVVVYAAVYRSMQLLKFLENHTTKECNSIRIKLCEALETDSLSKHMKFIFEWLERLDFEPKTANQIFRVSQTQQRQEFDKFSISCDDVFDSIVKDDYTKFKEKPFLNIKDGEYGIINNTFAANLIYNRLRFAILSICKSSNLCDFSHWYNTEFIEKCLFESVLKYSFNASKAVSYTHLTLPTT